MWSCRVGQVKKVGNIPSCIYIHTIIFHGNVGVYADKDLDKTHLSIRQSTYIDYKEFLYIDNLIPDDIISSIYNTAYLHVVSQEKLLRMYYYRSVQV